MWKVGAVGIAAFLVVLAYLRPASADEQPLWSSTFEVDCDKRDSERLPAEPSENEYQILHSVLSFLKANGDPYYRKMPVLLRDRTIPAPQGAVDRYQYLERNQSNREIEPSAISALIYLSKVPIRFRIDRGLKLPADSLLSEDSSKEIAEGWYLNAIIPLVVELSRPGIGCSLETAIVFARLTCGPRCGESRVIELRSEGGSWKVINSMIASKS